MDGVQHGVAMVFGSRWVVFISNGPWSTDTRAYMIAFQSYPSSSAVLATSLPSLVSAGLNRDRRVEMCSALLQIGSLESPKVRSITLLMPP